MRLSRQDRIIALVVAIGAAALLGVSAWLSPSADGIGTHTQLGLASCQWAEDLSIPCPTCGMTTTFAMAADGQLLRAGQNQPFGLILVMLTVVAFWTCLHSAITGSRASSLLLLGITHPRVMYPGVLVFLASWGYKALMWSGS